MFVGLNKSVGKITMFVVCWFKKKETLGEISMFVGLNKSVGKITMFVVCWF